MRTIVESLIAAARSTAGRAVAVVAALTGVAFIVRGLGPAAVAHAIADAARYFPFVLLLDGAQLFCTMRSLRSLYGEDGRKVPAAALARAGLIGFAVMALVPAGRAVAEVTRAALLSRFAGGPTAAAGAARMQAVALIVNCFVSVLACLAALAAVGPGIVPLAIAGNALVTLLGGLGLLFVGRHSGLGAWVGKRLPQVNSFGIDVDERLAREPLWPVRAIGWECLSRACQVAQNAILVVAVGGALGLGPALASEGIHLVGTAVGELVPAQIGFIEASYTFCARALGLAPSAAVAIGMLQHLSQLCWVLVGSLVPLVWPAPHGDAAVGPGPGPGDSQPRGAATS